MLRTARGRDALEVSHWFKRYDGLTNVRATIYGLIASRQQRQFRWASARDGWAKAVASLPRDDRTSQTYCNFNLHLGVCQFFLDQRNDARVSLSRAARSAAVSKTTDYRLLQARLLRHENAVLALSILRTALQERPNDTPTIYEFCSISLDSPNPAEALPYASRLRVLDPDNVSFLLLSADLAERAARWPLAKRELEQLRKLTPKDPNVYKRLITANEFLGDIQAARAVAVSSSTEIPGERIVWHQLLEVYERAGRLDKARVICRFLVRQWPHSRWHALKYAELLAMSGRLGLSDRQLARVGGNVNDVAFATALWTTAKAAGGRHEARDRLRIIRSAAPLDLQIDLDYGYALADVEGVQAASSHFDALLISHGFHPRVMHAIGHMAVRERVNPATLAAWERASAFHPDDAYAHQEYCRALLEAGQGGRAEALCRAGLSRFENDRAYIEFYVWLSAAVGRFAETTEFCKTHLPRYPNAWQLLEIGLICAIYARQVDEYIGFATTQTFTIASSSDALRFYTIMRVASIVGREGALAGHFLVGPEIIGTHPWLNTFSWTGQGEPTVRAMPRAPITERLYEHARVSRMIGRDTSKQFDALPPEAIDTLLIAPRSNPRKVISIFSRFEQARGGTELHALDLASRLRDHAEVELWAPAMCHSSFIESGMVRVIDPVKGDLPASGGVVVLIGLYFDLGPWIQQIAPSRVIALYNTFEAPQAALRLEACYRWTGVKTDLLYCSALMGDELGLPGVFEPSPTDLVEFSPGLRTDNDFVVGRHSRDVVEKHHPGDAEVYRAVSAMGGRSIVLGGLCMSQAFGPIEGLDLRPAAARGVADFLRGLNCFYYRTGTWVEPWGRVVIEALACGLPVVAHRRGGYAQVIRHGVNGFLFDETEEAIALIKRLADDPALRRELGANARASAEAVVGPEAVRRLAAFYLFEPVSGAPT